ncbi:glycosyltransferase [Rhodanobacter spathiphylli]|nr:glycosyltransferase [Rhodanobacter spathiphylli]
MVLVVGAMMEETVSASGFDNEFGADGVSLIVLPTAMAGGSESVAFGLAHTLAATGQDVIVFVMACGMQTSLSQFAKLSNVRLIVQRYRSEKLSSLLSAVRISAISRRYRLRLVYSTHLHVNAMLGLLRHLGAMKCDRLAARESTIISRRFKGFKGSLMRLLYRFGYGRQDLLIAQTEEMKEALPTFVRRSLGNRIAVIKNPFVPRDLSKHTKHACICSQRRIVACGRLVEIKGYDRLLRAFKIHESSFPEYSLFIIGDGPERDRLQELCSDLGIEQKVTFHGHSKSPLHEMSGASMGVVSSRSEGFPNVILEMMYAGVADIVSTPCTESISKIEGVHVAEDLSVEALAEQMRICAKKPSNNSLIYASYLREEHSMEVFASQVVGHRVSMPSDFQLPSLD